MSRERLLIRTLLELADTMVADYDIVDFLYLLCERAVEIADADAAGVLLMNGNGDLEVAAASSYEMRRLEQVEADLLQGPCVQAHRTGAQVDDGDLRASAERWPEFAEEAAKIGFRSVHACPLRLRGESIGALNVFRRATGLFSADDAEVLGGLAAMTAIGIVSERSHADAEQQVHQLRYALDKRAVVDQATAVLADRLGSDHGLALDWLRRYARNHNQRLRDVAQRFLNGELMADALAPPSDQAAPDRRKGSRREGR